MNAASVSAARGGFNRSSKVRTCLLALLLLRTCLFVLVLSSGVLAEATSAIYTSHATNPSNSLTATQLGAPSSLTATASGHDVQLNWAAGQNGSGYTVLGASTGSSSNCTGASFTALGTSSATSYLDSGRFAPQGTWFCYQVKTSYGSWMSLEGNPTAAARIGFVATSVQLVNAGNTSGCDGSSTQQSGTAGTLDCGDQIIITFNQAVDPATGPGGSDSVCANQAANVIWLGSTTSGAFDCAATETVNLGHLTGGTIGSCDCRFAATYTWSNNNTRLTVTVGARTQLPILDIYPTVSSATWTFSPTTTSSKLLSASGSVHICDTNSGGGNCLPSTASASASSMTLAPTRRLPAPEEVTLHSDGGIHASWRPLQEDGVAGYLYRRGTRPGQYNFQFDAGDRTGYHDTGVMTGATYYVVIAAYDHAGHLGEPSREVSITVPAASPSATPSPVRGTVPSATPSRTPAPPDIAERTGTPRAGIVHRTVVPPVLTPAPSPPRSTPSSTANPIPTSLPTATPTRASLPTAVVPTVLPGTTMPGRAVASPIATVVVPGGGSSPTPTPAPPSPRRPADPVPTGASGPPGAPTGTPAFTPTPPASPRTTTR